MCQNKFLQLEVKNSIKTTMMPPCGTKCDLLKPNILSSSLSKSHSKKIHNLKAGFIEWDSVISKSLLCAFGSFVTSCLILMSSLNSFTIHLPPFIQHLLKTQPQKHRKSQDKHCLYLHCAQSLTTFSPNSLIYSSTKKNSF